MTSCKMSFRACLFLRLLMIMAMFPSTFGSVDMSLAVVISTQLRQEFYSALKIFYGDPDVYLPEIIRNQTSNLSYQQTLVYRPTTVSALLSNGPVEVDYRRAELYWTNEHRQTLTTYPWILRQSNNTAYYEFFAANISYQVTGLALDWVSNLLYISDAGYQRIGVIDSIMFTNWRIVVDTNLSSPQDVVVYPPQNYLFWCDAGSTPKIERLDLAQNNRTVLIKSPVIQSPKTLVIDYVSLRLYWLDTATEEVSSVNLDGSFYSPWQLSLFSRISSFFLYKQYFAFADQSTFTVYIFNGRQNIYNLTNSSLSGISDIVMFEPSRQPNITNSTPTTTTATTTTPTTPTTTTAKSTTTTAATTAAAITTATTKTTTSTTSGSGSTTGGKWTMAMFFTVLVFLQIRAAATN